MLIRRNPPSQMQLAACRANALKSAGPLSPQGRRQAARNSMKHGFAAAGILLPEESAAEFRVLCDSLCDEYHPGSELETHFIHVMAAARWRLSRLAQLEAAILEPDLAPAECVARAEKWAALVTRYGSSEERRYRNARQFFLNKAQTRNSEQINSPNEAPIPLKTSGAA